MAIRVSEGTVVTFYFHYFLPTWNGNPAEVPDGENQRQKTFKFDGMEKTKENLFTVQGRDTPVQVRPGSGDAGSRGPSASDCATNTDTAISQAVEDVNATGTKSDKECQMQTKGNLDDNPFRRRSSILRTPPQSRKSSLVEVESPLTENILSEPEQWQDENMVSNFFLKHYKSCSDDGVFFNENTHTNKKRKRNGKEEEKKTDEIDPELNEVLKVVESLSRRTDELKKLIKESTKTKIKIKSSSREISNIVSTLNRKMSILVT